MEFLGLEITTLDGVYQPDEDSFMLAMRAREIAAGGGSMRILEIGCGTGIASLACAGANAACSVLGIDANPEAVRNARENAARNGIGNATFCEGDMFEKADGKYGLVMFNPPYLPTGDDEKVSGGLNLAFDGGPDGREQTRRFLAGITGVLAQGGTALLLQSSLSGIDESVQGFVALGMDAKITARKRFFFEELALVEAVAKS
jgi:release factor glutamine methyltransferase